MNNPVIISIVEGQGDATAVPLLLRRILGEEFGRYDVKIKKPIIEHRGNLVKKDKLSRAVEMAARKIVACGTGCILILFDADKDCPGKLAPRILRMAKDARSDMNISVVIVKKEYEAWLVASMETLSENVVNGIIEHSKKAEEISDPKYFLKDSLGQYTPTVDQARLTAKIDIRIVRERCPSFDKLWRELESFCDRHYVNDTGRQE